jgi:crossover junction endodeoxyribonuclease RusA
MEQGMDEPSPAGELTLVLPLPPSINHQYATVQGRRIYFVSALRRDLDGGLKIAQDALCEALGINDNLVVEIHLSKRVDRHSPRIEVHLTALAAESVILEAGGKASSTPFFPLPLDGKPKRRRRRKQRSLEELAARHRWNNS